MVSAVYGLGGLVSGELDADTYRVRFTLESAQVEVARSQDSRCGSPRRDRRLETVPEERMTTPALTDAQAIAIAQAARALEAPFGSPQDVEWALAGTPERLVVLQTRPITTLGAPRTAPSTGERWVWDNSNIIESYSGVTTPLTFTFAREVYESVYRQFCRLMGTPETLLESHRPVFANMLGLVRGRVYYNLLNWYRTLALLPGFQFNRSFMERMMGVREALADPPPAPSAGNRLRDLASLVRMVLRMMREAGRLQQEVPAFRARVERAIGPIRHEDIAAWPAEKALDLYHRLERELLDEWRAPLVNDFFAMVFFGVLSRLTERWLPGSPPTRVNDLLCGEGGIVSTEPARRVMALARLVRQTPQIVEALAAEPDDQKRLRCLATVPAAAELEREIHRYLDDFGDRCMEELKLETVTLAEDPSFLIAMIRAYAARGIIDPDAAWARERAIRMGAEAEVRAGLPAMKHAVYRWVLVRTRRRVRDRENLRFERTRVFGVVRRIVLALGHDLGRRGHRRAARRLLSDPSRLFAAFEDADAATELSPIERATPDIPRHGRARRRLRPLRDTGPPGSGARNGSRIPPRRLLRLSPTRPSCAAPDAAQAW